MLEELNCKTVFTIPIFGGLDISESTVITWFIIAFVAVLCMILVRNLSVESPSKKQQVLELAVGGLYNIFDGLL